MSKALVVDDSRTIRTILKRILAELSFEVYEAANGLEALQILALQKDAVALVLADWNMPEMNGLDMLKKIRQDASFDSLRIVMVTTEAELGHMSSALEAGANEYVMKPFTKDILREKLELIGINPVAGV